MELWGGPVHTLRGAWLSWGGPPHPWSVAHHGLKRPTTAHPHQPRRLPQAAPPAC